MILFQHHALEEMRGIQDERYEEYLPFMHVLHMYTLYFPVHIDTFVNIYTIVLLLLDITNIRQAKSFT